MARPSLTSNRLAFIAPLIISCTCASVLFAQSSTQTTLRNPPAGADTVLLVTLGTGDTAETKWDGSIEVENGTLVRLIGYEMRVGDIIHPPRRWEASTRKPFPFSRRPHDEGILQDLDPSVHLSPRFHVYLKAGEATRVVLNTTQGEVAFRVSEIPVVGAKSLLDGRVSIQHSAYPILVGRGGERPPSERLTDNDFSSLTVAQDGSIWVAWTGFRDGADRVYAEKIAPGASIGSGRRPHEVSPPGGDVFHTAVGEDSEGKIWVVWSERASDNWDLYARAFDGQSWSRIQRLTRASQPDTQHNMARDSQGRLHLVWQGYRNNRAGIFHKSYDAGSGWSRETRISSPAAPNCWEPSIAIDSKDDLHVAWDQYGPKGYDVWLRSRSSGNWASPVGVAVTERFEAYVSLAVDQQDRVWLAWHESGINWGKDWGYPFDITANAVGLYNSRNIRMAVYDGGRLSQPKQSLEDALPGPGPGGNFYEYPQLAVDASNRVWAFFRHRRPAQHNLYDRTPSHHALWEIYASCYEDDAWSPMVLLPYSTGRNDMRISITRGPDGNLAAAWPTDRRSFRDFVNMLPDIFAARLPSPDGSAPAAQLTAYAPPPARPAPRAPHVPEAMQPRDGVGPVHPNEAADVQRIRDYTYRMGDKNYKIYRGDMHRHTEISWDGYSDGSTEDTYRYAMDVASLDFLAITEHNFGVMDEYDWWRSQKFVDLFRVGSNFVPLFGYERSVKYPNGHRNVIFPYRGAPVLDVQHYEWDSGNANFAYTRQGPERFFAYLRKYNAIAMPHTSATGMGTDWADYDPEVEPVVEIYQSDRTNYECPDCWRAADPNVVSKQYGGLKPAGFVSKAWAKGYRLGVQASSDHLGVHTAYSMILAEENSREALVDAIRKRHTYGATDNIIIDFRLVDGDKHYLMGDETSVSSPPRFRIHVEGTAPIGDVEIVKDNEMVYSQNPGAQVVDFEYRDNEVPGEEASFYYLRVRQTDRDKQIGWSSPIWVSGPSR